MITVNLYYTGSNGSARAFAIFPYGYPDEEREQQDHFDQSSIHYIV